LLSFSVAIIDPVNNFGDIINVILISFLSVIAFRFSLSGILPVVPYMTRADLYIMGNFLLGTILIVIASLLNLE
jgi:hypothetical protein